MEDLHRIKNDLYHTNLNNEHTISSLLAKVEECEEKRKFAELNNNYLLEEIKNVRQKCATFDVDNKFWRKKYDDAIVEQNSLKVKIDHSEIKMHNLFRQIGLIHSEIVEACFKIDAVDRNTESTMLHSKEVEQRINVLESVLEKKAEVLDKSISVSPADFLMLGMFSEHNFPKIFTFLKLSSYPPTSIGIMKSDVQNIAQVLCFTGFEKISCIARSTVCKTNVMTISAVWPYGSQRFYWSRHLLSRFCCKQVYADLRKVKAPTLSIKTMRQRLKNGCVTNF